MFRSTRTLMDRRCAAALIAPPLFLALAACGTSQDDTGVASAGGAAPTESGSPAGQDTDGDSRKLFGCLRENGVDVEDPDGDGAVALGGGDPAAMEKAMEACREYMPNGGEVQAVSPEQLTYYRAYAQCMRDEGIDMGDPDPEQGMPAPADGTDLEKLQAAHKTCSSKLADQAADAGITR